MTIDPPVYRYQLVASKGYLTHPPMLAVYVAHLIEVASRLDPDDWNLDPRTWVWEGDTWPAGDHVLTVTIPQAT